MRQDGKMQILNAGYKGSRIIAVLCNPPLKPPEQTTSWRNLQCLKTALKADDITICNLIEAPSQSTRDLRHLADVIDTTDLQGRVRSATAQADLVIAAWGTTAPAGWKVGEWSRLIMSTLHGMAESSHTGAIHVGPGCRHPSRWRQYTSPQHNRFDGDTFQDRLLDSLQWSSVKNLAARSTGRQLSP